MAPPRLPVPLREPLNYPISTPVRSLFFAHLRCSLTRISARARSFGMSRSFDDPSRAFKAQGSRRVARAVSEDGSPGSQAGQSPGAMSDPHGFDAAILAMAGKSCQIISPRATNDPAPN